MPYIKLKTAATTSCYNMFTGCGKMTIDTGSYGKKIINVTSGPEGWSEDMFDIINANEKTKTPVTGTTYYQICASVTLNNYGYGVYSSFTDVRIKTPGVKAYTGKLNGDVLTLTEIDTDVIPAGTGVFLNGGRDMSGQVVEFENLNTSSAPLPDNDFVATTSSQGDLLEREAGKLYYNLNLNNIFSGSEFIIRHNMAVLTTTSSVNRKNNISLKFAEVDLATGINEVCTPANAQTKYMDNGRIVILKNGKKYNAAGQRIE